MSERRHDPVFPGFKEVAARRRAMADTFVEHRSRLGLSQTEVAARMGTSQSAVARLESGDADVRLSTLERYAAALGQQPRHPAATEEPVNPFDPGSGRDPFGGPLDHDPAEWVRAQLRGRRVVTLTGRLDDALASMVAAGAHGARRRW